METYYYYEENNQQKGPFTFEELKEKKLKKNTLVWKDGLDDWVEASQLEELQGITVPAPPPLPKKNIPETEKKSENTILTKVKSLVDNKKEYDNTYQKPTNLILVGIIYAIIVVVGSIIISKSYDSDEIYPYWFYILIFLRALIATEVIIRSEEQNRNGLIWGIFAIFLPAIAIIVISLLPKLKVEKCRYDLKAEKEYSIAIWGAVILSIGVFIPALKIYDMDSESATILIFIDIVLRFIFVYIAYRTALKLNRSKLFSLWAFFNPGLSLYILGFLRRLKFEIKSDMTIGEIREKAEFFLKHNFYDDYEITAKYLIKNGEQKTPILLNLSKIYLEEKEFEKLEEVLAELSKNDYIKDKLYDIYIKYIDVLYKEKEFEKLEEVLAELSKNDYIKDKLYDIYIKYIDVLYKEKEFEKVRGLLSFLENKSKKLDKVYYYYALLYLKDKQIENAIKYFEKSAELKNKDAQTMLNRFNNSLKGVFLLNKKGINKKLDFDKEFYPNYSVTGYWNSSESNSFSFEKAKIFITDKGIAIKFSKQFIGILYTEIEKIEYDPESEQVTFYLIKNNVLKIRVSEHFYKEICVKAKEFLFYDICKNSSHIIRRKWK